MALLSPKLSTGSPPPFGLGGGGTPPPPVQMKVSLSPSSSSSPLVSLNVRETLEKESVAEAKDISRKIHFEIERKKEDLRVLVGERYRDLIEAADTIVTMRTSSKGVFEQLTALRDKFSSFPSQLVQVKSPRVLEERTSRLNEPELEMALELKLLLEVPRQVNALLDKKAVVPALHLYLYYEKYLLPGSKRYLWTFMQANSSKSVDMCCEDMKSSLLSFCRVAFANDDGRALEGLVNCMIAEHLLSGSSVEQVIKEFLDTRVTNVSCRIGDKDELLKYLCSSLHAIYAIFIDPQLYNSAAKKVKKPIIFSTQLGIHFTSKSIESFQNEMIPTGSSPRVPVIAEIVSAHFFRPLTALLENSYSDQTFLSDADGYKDFASLAAYRAFVVASLKQSKETQDLMRIVLGTSKNIWTEVFYPAFKQKCMEVCENVTKQIFGILEKETFPKYRKLDDQFDLVSFLWKSTNDASGKSDFSAETDLKLKLNSLSPQLANLCIELDGKFQELSKDFQDIDDSAVKGSLSSHIVEKMNNFLNTQDVTRSKLFIGKFCTAQLEFCPSMWKLLSQNDKQQLRRLLQEKCEECWGLWCDEVVLQFTTALSNKVIDLKASTIAVFIPIAEKYSSTSETGEIVKPSVNVPLQIAHPIFHLLFGVCTDIAKVGPQAIPDSLRGKLRHQLGLTIEKTYRSLIEKSKSEESDGHLVPQVAAQFIFDLKFCQWMHSDLMENPDMKTLITNLQSVIDPFDLDIVLPRININLKRFLYETHLTLGLLFSEESHSFIAQNFKPKEKQALDGHRQTNFTSFPLLPI